LSCSYDTCSPYSTSSCCYRSVHQLHYSSINTCSSTSGSSSNHESFINTGSAVIVTRTVPSSTLPTPQPQAATTVVVSVIDVQKVPFQYGGVNCYSKNGPKNLDKKIIKHSNQRKVLNRNGRFQTSEFFERGTVHISWLVPKTNTASSTRMKTTTNANSQSVTIESTTLNIATHTIHDTRRSSSDSNKKQLKPTETSPMSWSGYGSLDSVPNNNLT
jgi:hypothetical protein